jgi:GNAT superfamily N-acetyltransferase
MTFKIRPIEAGDKLTGLSLGDEAYLPLKVFVQRHAKAYQQQSLARSYGAFSVDTATKGKLLGYMSLVCGEVVIDDADDPIIADVDYRYRHYPAVKIARLAVDARWRGQNIGGQLIELSLAIALEVIAPQVGCRFLMVDAKQPSVEFYEKLGFTLLDTAANRARNEPIMFIDLAKVGA